MKKASRLTQHFAIFVGVSTLAPVEDEGSDGYDSRDSRQDRNPGSVDDSDSDAAAGGHPRQSPATPVGRPVATRFSPRTEKAAAATASSSSSSSSNPTRGLRYRVVATAAHEGADGFVAGGIIHKAKKARKGTLELNLSKIMDSA